MRILAENLKQRTSSVILIQLLVPTYFLICQEIGLNLAKGKKEIHHKHHHKGHRKYMRCCTLKQ
jgi:hypothetical protein